MVEQSYANKVLAHKMGLLEEEKMVRLDLSYENGKEVNMMCLSQKLRLSLDGSIPNPQAKAPVKLEGLSYEAGQEAKAPVKLEDLSYEASKEAEAPVKLEPCMPAESMAPEEKTLLFSGRDKTASPSIDVEKPAGLEVPLSELAEPPKAQSVSDSNPDPLHAVAKQQPPTKPSLSEGCSDVKAGAENSPILSDAQPAVPVESDAQPAVPQLRAAAPPGRPRSGRPLGPNAVMPAVRGQQKMRHEAELEKRREQERRARELRLRQRYREQLARGGAKRPASAPKLPQGQAAHAVTHLRNKTS